MLTHLLNFFIVTKRISYWHHFWKWKFLHIVHSAGGRFCWDYVTDTLEQLCRWQCLLQLWRFWGPEALVQLCRWYFPLQLCWWIWCTNSSDSFSIEYVYLCWQESLAIMQVVLSAVSNCFYCKMQLTASVIAMKVTLSSNNFIFLSLTDTHFS